ncbi:MAG: nuclear transport factor 2 family protein [Acidimicrobiales bacterium]
MGGAGDSHATDWETADLAASTGRRVPVRRPTGDDGRELMRRFKRGFARADPTELGAVITDDFEWHLHHFPADRPSPTGTVLRGLDQVMAEIRWRQEHWHGVRFNGMVERYLGDLVVQTFTVSGHDEHHRPFTVDAVDLYRIVDDRLASKDTYWKQPSTRH